MYLGRFVGITMAKDNGQLFAQAPEAAAKVTASLAAPEQAPSPQLIDSSVAEKNHESMESELVRLRQANGVLRGRVLTLLSVLRGKNRVIARQERELAAHSAVDKLTVADLQAQLFVEH